VADIMPDAVGDSAEVAPRERFGVRQ